MPPPAGTQNRRTLQAINDLLEGKVAKDIQSYVIAGRQLFKMSTEDLLRLKAEYTRRCLDENNQPLFGQVKFR